MGLSWIKRKLFSSSGLLSDVFYSNVETSIKYLLTAAISNGFYKNPLANKERKEKLFYQN